MPTSGGQYYWIAVLAPRSCRRYLSYIAGEHFPFLILHLLWFYLTYSNVGWLCAITWQTGVAGGAFLTGTTIQGLFVLNIETYNYQRWHGSLLTLAILLV